MNWVTINIPYIERIMPAAQWTAYNAWIAADSDHYMRAILMAENIVMECRCGIQRHCNRQIDDMPNPPAGSTGSGAPTA